METEKSPDAVLLRQQCSECKHFYTATKKKNGDIVGQCPRCKAKYFEHGNGTMRLIKIIRKKQEKN